jgi:hypothetical protein
MTQNGVDAERLAALRATVMGPVLTPDGSGYEKAPPAWHGVTAPDYDEARKLWNARFDSRPAVIVQAMGVADIQEAVRFARANDLVIAVRGGGHTPSGSSTVDGGLVIDLRLLRGVHVDAGKRTAVAAGGTLLAELDRETQAHGLAVTSGTVSHTGVGGLTLFGGVGRMMRKYGLTVDNLLALDIVTADGEWLHADADEHPDLYWALRGGGGTFGVVTHFTYALHPVGPIVYGGYLGWPIEQSKDVYQAVREELVDAPEELWVQFIFCTAPAADFVPPQLQGQPSLMMTVTWVGEDLEAGERAIAPFRERVAPTLDVVGPFPYAFLQAASDPLAPHGMLNCGAMPGFLDDLTEEIFDAGLALAETFPSDHSIVELAQMGGAVTRVPVEATAAPAAFRDARFSYVVGSNTLDEAEIETCRQWVLDADAALEPYRRPGRYVNFMSEDGEDAMRDALGEDNYARLMEIKATYDPDGVFSYNPNRRTAAIS